MINTILSCAGQTLLWFTFICDVPREKTFENMRRLDLPAHSVSSPNIARPLTLRTSPSDYATFNQIRSILFFNIGLLLEREKQQNVFTLCAHCWAGVDLGKKWKMLLKTPRTVISNDTGYFMLFTLNQVIEEVNCWEQPGVTFSGIFCESN